MSVALVISSEEQLRLGADWGIRVAEAGDHHLHVLVLGTDRAVLQKVAQSRLTEKLAHLETQLESVTVVAESVEAVDAFVHETDCQWLLIMHGMDRFSVQQQIFERAVCSSIWLKAADEPPIGEGHLWGLSQSQAAAIASIGVDLLELHPCGFLYEELPAVAATASDAEADQGAGESYVTEPPPNEKPSEKPSETVVDRVAASEMQPSDLILVGIERGETNGRGKDSSLSLGIELLNDNGPLSVALVRRGSTRMLGWAGRLRRWADSIAPPMERDQRKQLTDELVAGSEPNWEYLGLISASAMLAAFGLIQNSAAVIIGAMLIAPLMTPILGGGLALSVGNRPLFRASWITIGLGFFGALTASVLFGFLVRLFQDPVVTTEMASRCHPGPLDFCVGLVGGIAASYARTRTHLSSALAGAAIAAALVPPISTAGLLLAFEGSEAAPDKTQFLRPLLLLATNVLTIMVGSSFVLWARGIRPEHRRDSGSRWSLRTFILLTILVLMLLASAVYSNTTATPVGPSSKSHRSSPEEVDCPTLYG